MATLSALHFETADGAERMIERLKALQQQQLITIEDAAIVSWPAGKKKPKTRQLHNLAGLGALEGSFWGMLFGLIFFVPFLGMAIGAGIGALTAGFADLGIDDKFINDVQNKVTEGTSALFLLTSGAVPDRVAEAVKDLPFEIISTNLSTEDEERLRAAFSAEESSAPAGS